MGMSLCSSVATSKVSTTAPPKFIARVLARCSCEMWQRIDMSLKGVLTKTK